MMPSETSGRVLPPAFHFANPVANFVQHRPLVQAFPRSNQAHGGHAVLVRLIGGFGYGFGIHKTVLGRTGLVKGRLRAETAIFRTGAGLGVDDGAKVNFVPFEFFADAVGPRQEV